MKHIKLFEELGGKWPSDKNKLQSGKLYAIEEDGGDCLYFRGVYDDLDNFLIDIKSYISDKESIELTDITEEFEKLDNNDAILIKYGHSEDIFYYKEIKINQFLNF